MMPCMCVGICSSIVTTKELPKLRFQLVLVLLGQMEAEGLRDTSRAAGKRLVTSLLADAARLTHVL